MQFRVRLQCDDAPGESVDVDVTECMGEWPGVDSWEQKVRGLGFQAMREMFAHGLRLFERGFLAQWTHLDGDCRLVRRGRIGVTLATVFGKVCIDRQRLFCRRCHEWTTPLNAELGLHEAGASRMTVGFRGLCCLCGIHQP